MIGFAPKSLKLNPKIFEEEKQHEKCGFYLNTADFSSFMKNHKQQKPAGTESLHVKNGDCISAELSSEGTITFFHGFTPIGYAPLFTGIKNVDLLFPTVHFYAQNDSATFVDLDDDICDFELRSFEDLALKLTESSAIYAARSNGEKIEQLSTRVGDAIKEYANQQSISLQKRKEAEDRAFAELNQHRKQVNDELTKSVVLKLALKQKEAAKIVAEKLKFEQELAQLRGELIQIEDSELTFKTDHCELNSQRMLINLNQLAKEIVDLECEIEMGHTNGDSDLVTSAQRRLAPKSAQSENLKSEIVANQENLFRIQIDGEKRQKELRAIEMQRYKDSYLQHYENAENEMNLAEECEKSLDQFRNKWFHAFVGKLNKHLKRLDAEEHAVITQISILKDMQGTETLEHSEIQSRRNTIQRDKLKIEDEIKSAKEEWHQQTLARLVEEAKQHQDDIQKITRRLDNVDQSLILATSDNNPEIVACQRDLIALRNESKTNVLAIANLQIEIEQLHSDSKEAAAESSKSGMALAATLSQNLMDKRTELRSCELKSKEIQEDMKKNRKRNGIFEAQGQSVCHAAKRSGCF